jgi:hypothetical protein
MGGINIDENPITKLFCKDCQFWKPVGFYTFEREMDPEKRKCKHLKRCERVYKMALKKTGQMELSEFIGGDNGKT